LKLEIKLSVFRIARMLYFFAQISQNPMNAGQMILNSRLNNSVFILNASGRQTFCRMIAQ